MEESGDGAAEARSRITPIRMESVDESADGAADGVLDRMLSPWAAQRNDAIEMWAARHDLDLVTHLASRL